jgi:hypothetical protein
MLVAIDRVRSRSISGLDRWFEIRTKVNHQFVAVDRRGLRSIENARNLQGTTLVDGL